jgi:hypothetical protein
MLTRNNLLIGGAIFFSLLLLGFGWHALLAKAAENAEVRVLREVNENINGHLQVDHMDLSWNGALLAHQVLLYDSQNTLIGSTETMSIEYGFFDLLSGNVALKYLKGISLDNPSLTLIYSGNHWNLADVLKKNGDQPFSFRGLLKIKQGKATVNTVENRQLDALNGYIDFARYPAIGINLAGQSKDTPFSLKGSWNFKGDGTLDVSTTKIALKEIPFAHLLPKELTVSDGMVQDLIITLVQQANKLSICGEGTFENVAATGFGFIIQGGTGSFKLIDGKLNLQNTTLVINNQQVVISGLIGLLGPDLNLDLMAVSTAFDPAIFTAGGSLLGPISFEAKVAGSATKPTTAGTFSIPQGTLSTVPFTNAMGNFSYGEGKLTLTNSHAEAWDGTLTLAGDILPLSEQYNLSIQGIGVDSSLLTDKDIHGRMSFSASVNGQGTTNTSATGNFKMGAGSISSIAFLNMTGNFAKQSSEFNLTNLMMQTATGTLRAEGYSDGPVFRLTKTELIATDPHGSMDKNTLDQLRKLVH